MQQDYFDPALYPALDAYIDALFAAEDEPLRFARSLAAEHRLPNIAINPNEGRLLRLLALAVGARRIVEIGTLGGYSGLWLARALPPGGMLYTLEANPRHADLARQVFVHAGLSDRVTIVPGSAADTMPKISGHGPFDMVFIDADKDSYPAYLDWSLDNVRPGGMITAHNALCQGRVTQPAYEGDQAVRQFNEAVAHHPRLTGTIINVGDGLLAAVVLP